ncbi:MAG: pyridoxamine 5'-phosphate oxidase family protein [Bacteroidota bacterium]
MVSIMFNSEDQSLLKKCVLCWLATADTDGQPNVSPKEIFTTLGSDRLLIANIASPQSAKNVQQNGAVAISCLDIFTQKGIQLKGTATLVQVTDERFADLAEPLLEMTQGLFPFRSIFVVKITAKRPLLAPRYLLFPDTTEAEQVTSAMRAYGVQKA